ncbi:Cell division control protein-like protein [Hapsidospora chrysogenum ATCC 11550]|uniref:Cell division control protein n=1 Tax=Hapsidospora chrysogenum (strain ATCC 11550 / CBS 779.69 / DSM 880 / IAM 14645 / JCM 23072 / IMI 49137) TaxID=857340 RepID=A0A086T6J5_HAPC1|nr:Cell division control protein-like protein [Hapsidospora chrysogenum ATCC 11550]
MPSATLGKRTRDAVEAVIPQTPSKRPRRAATKPVIYNDENLDPETVPDQDEDVLSELPAKRQRTYKNPPVTPSTPRHRDALSSQPGTPRHVVMSAGKLFKRMTPSSPASPSTIQTIYHSARQLFAHGAEPGQLIGRESEREQLASFLQRCSPSSTSPSGCLYVSGPPGTGKSAMVTEILRQHSETEGVQSAYVNCMSIKSSKDLYNTLLEAVSGNGHDLSESDALSTLQELFCSKKKTSPTVYLVMLDEIDHILTMGLECLYRLFEWSLQKPSRLTLVGIANALDLTDRFLPRLKSMNLKPELLPFLPYTAPQIKHIITTRLKSLMPQGKEAHVPFIHPAAIELCSRKVSSQTGDLRKAFEICRRALDLIEMETRSKHEDEAREKLLQTTPSKRPLGEKVNDASGHGRSKSIVQVMAESLKSLTVETAPRASIAHLNKVTAAAFSNGTTQRMKALNLQQKAALCALVAYEKRAREKAKSAEAAGTPSKSQTILAPTVKMLFDTYCRLCTRESVLHPLSSSEFREVVGSLETLGLVNAVEGKNGSFMTPQTPSKRGRKATAAASGNERRIASATGEKDMESMTDGIGSGILKSILSGEALD